jgi:hypothetical protein
MTATYLGSGDPARRRTDYYPVWLDHLADDVTLEASAINGAAQGPEAIRSIILAVKSLYAYQDINFTGDYGDGKYFIEDYTTQIHGQPFGVMGVITRNADGQTQHIVVNQRPRDTVLLVARTLAEKFAGTPNARFFASTPS